MRCIRTSLCAAIAAGAFLGSSGLAGIRPEPATGVYSFNTFAQPFAADPGPSGRLAAMPVPDVLASAVAWKQKRADWVLLQRLLRASAAAGGLQH
jgi:hypothetical protein